MGKPGGLVDLVILQYRVAYGNALVADVGAGVIAGGRDELTDYVLALMAKRASQGIIGSGALHAVSLLYRTAVGNKLSPVRPQRAAIYWLVLIIT
jgi:hypothetical protein